MQKRCVLAMVAVLPVVGFAQGPTTVSKRTVKIEDFKNFERLGVPQISNDGRWVSYVTGKEEADPILVLRNPDGPEKWEIAAGRALTFSDDSRWAGYRVGPTRAESEKAAAERRPPASKWILRDLKGNSETAIDGVRSARFLKGSRYVLLHKMGPRPACDLVVWDLERGSGVTLGNVTTYVLNRDQTKVVVQYKTEAGENGLQLYDPKLQSLRTIRAGKEDFDGMTFAEKADVLAFMVGRADPKKEGRFNLVVTWRRNGDDWSETVYDPAQDAKFPKGYRISEAAPLQLSDSGTAIGFGIKPWEDKQAPDPTKPQDKPGVDIWHYKDVEPMPLQIRMGAADKERTFAAVLRGGNFVQVGNSLRDEVQLLGPDFGTALVGDPNPYRSGVRAGGLTYLDWDWVNLTDGSRQRVVPRRAFAPLAAPDGSSVLYWKDRAWWGVRLGDPKPVNLTAALKANFEDDRYDGPQPEAGPAAFPTFLDDRTPVLYDVFDAWRIDARTGVATRLTEGAANQTSYRLVRSGFSPAGEPDLRQQDPLYFETFHRWTKVNGYHRLNPDGTSKPLLTMSASLGSLNKARDADRMIFSLESNQQPRNLFVTNTAMSEAKRVSNLNPQLDQFFWPKSELVDFTTKSGWKLQGTLTYPADYVPSRSYPMITTIYERLTDSFYTFQIPSETNPYDVQAWSQRGYFVFEPDITYRNNDPGGSALECIETGVKAVLAKKVGVDASRLGLTGHSWGGYQTAIVHTRSKMFRAAVAGAPLTELTSMYNSFYWNWGESNQVIFESSQGRYTKPFWEIPEAYLRNSPVWNAKTINGPFLMFFGDADGAVDWRQGQYFYQTLRRMGKEVIMVVYAGENHWPDRRPNQLDFTKRLNHFFDVYLKGAKPEAWITDGVPFIKK